MNSLSQLNVVDFSAALAADLAAGIHDQETIFGNHGLSEEEGTQLLTQDWFRHMVDGAKRDWDAIDNARERIRVKAQITLEESIPTIYAIIADRNTPGAARVAAFKELKEVAGMAAKDNEPTGPSFIPIQIFLDGRDQPPVTVGLHMSNAEPEVLEDEAIDEAEVVIPEPEAKPTPPAEEYKKTKEDGFFFKGMGDY